MSDSADEWYKYTCHYIDNNGSKFCIEIWAMNDLDAIDRVASIRKSLTLDGRLCATIDAVTGDVVMESNVPENTGTTH